MEKEDDTPQCLDVIVPEYMAFGSGDEQFTLVYDGLEYSQEDYIARLKEIYAGNVQVYTITESQYKQAMNQYGCSILKWPVSLPYQEFCQLCEVEASSAEGIAYMTSVAYSDAAKDSIFILDGVNRMYYRLAVEGAIFVRPEVDSETAAKSIYYPASVVLGCSSDAYIPIIEQSRQQLCRCEKEMARDDARTSMTEGIFGDTYDFVRRMTDDFGTITYMYGYGQKTLTVLQDGSCEYKAEVNGESQGFFNDLQTALNFISRCGGWDGGSLSLSYRLVDVKEEGSQRAKTYTFTFAEYINDRRIYSEGSDPLIISVSSGDISYYYRNAVRLTDVAMGEYVPVYDAANVIASNANHMYKVENDDALSPDTDKAFSVIADSIQSVSMGYYILGGDDSILPCWVVELDGGSCFFFDLYEGAPLGFTK